MELGSTRCIHTYHHSVGWPRRPGPNGGADLDVSPSSWPLRRLCDARPGFPLWSVPEGGKREGDPNGSNNERTKIRHGGMCTQCATPPISVGSDVAGLVREMLRPAALRTLRWTLLTESRGHLHRPVERVVELLLWRVDLDAFDVLDHRDKERVASRARWVPAQT